MTGTYDLVDHIAGILPAYCRLTGNMMTQLHWALPILGQNLGRWCYRHVSIGWSSAWLRARLVNKLSLRQSSPSLPQSAPVCPSLPQSAPVCPSLPQSAIEGLNKTVLTGFTRLDDRLDELSGHFALIGPVEHGPSGTWPQWNMAPVEHGPSGTWPQWNMAPVEHGHRCAFAAIVANNHLWLAIKVNQPQQLPCHTWPFNEKSTPPP